MAAFSTMKVSTRLTLGFSALAIVGIGIAIYGALKMHTLATRLDEVANNRMLKVAQFTEIKDNFNEIAKSTRNVVINDDAAFRSEQKKQIAAWRTENSRLLGELDKSLTLPKARALYQVLAETRGSYNQALDRVMAMAEKGDQAGAINLLYGDVLRLQTIAFKAADDSRALQKELAESLSQSAESAARSATILMGILALMMLAIGAFVAWAVTRDLARSLGAEPQALSEIAGRVSAGDLTTPLQVRNGDTASVMAAVARMQSSLSSVVSTVRAASESVACASAQIAQGNMDLSGRTEAQASALEQTAASMEELNSTVRQTADNAQQANQLARNASEVAIKGGEVVSQVVHTMKEINNSSQKIAEIISVIDNIAFQTNILALNAAVEAARAGEQGRGFAVVASEVRNLAGRSAVAAKEIRDLISASVERVAQGTKLVDQAGITMTAVVDSIQHVTDIVAEITAASSEQSAGVSQVDQAVSQIDQTTQKNAALVEEMAAAAASLRSHADGLVRSVDVFKLTPLALSARMNNPASLTPLLS